MGKHELEFGIAALKSRLEPVELLRPQGPAPLVAGLHIICPFARHGGIGQVHGVLEGVNDYEQYVTPRPGIVVLTVLVAAGPGVKCGQDIGVPGIEPV